MSLNRHLRGVLVGGLSELGIGATERMIGRFSVFVEELLLWNRHTNLVGTQDAEHIITRHLFDSLSAYSLLKNQKGSILDIGTGAGLPSIPLKIALPYLHITLCERRKKRAAFLRNAVSLLDLGGLTIFERDVRDIRQKFDIALARGIGELKEIVELATGVLKESAMIIAFKGKITEIEKEMERLKESNGEDKSMHIDIQKVKVPYLDKEERNIVIIQTK